MHGLAHRIACVLSNLHMLDYKKDVQSIAGPPFFGRGTRAECGHGVAILSSPGLGGIQGRPSHAARSESESPRLAIVIVHAHFTSFTY